jgi:hypothetical protein
VKRILERKSNPKRKRNL